MNSAIPTAVLVAAIGSALVGGISYAFSSLAMKALSRVPAAEGMAAMQSINVVVLNPSFLGLFMGTAAISLLVAVVAIGAWGTPSAPFWLVGAIVYLGGTFAVTAFGNVPLNDRLAMGSGHLLRTDDNPRKVRTGDARERARQREHGAQSGVRIAAVDALEEREREPHGRDGRNEGSGELVPPECRRQRARTTASIPL